MLIIVMIPATALAVIWLLLLGQTKQEDWVVAAYTKVLDNRLEIDRLRAKDEENRQKLAQYHGISAKVMKLIIGGDSHKAQAKLERQNVELQNGNLRSVGIFDMPGYVLQRRNDSIGKGRIHKKIMSQCVELYGKKYAANKTKQLLARLLSYPIVGIAFTLTLGALFMGMGKRDNGLAVLLVGTLIVLVLVYAQYDEISDRVNKRRKAISRQFPNVVSKLALLVTSGMVMDRAWRETAESQNLELYREMKKTSDELANMVAPNDAYTNFINRCNTKETTKLAAAIIQSQSKGNAEIGVLLKGMAHDAWQERRHHAKKDSEAANSKLMIPTMLLFATILVMIMVPVAMNFSSL